MKQLTTFIAVFTVVLALVLITDPSQAGKGGNGNGYPEGDHFNLNLIAKKSDPTEPSYFNCPSPDDYQWDYYVDNGICDPTVSLDNCEKCDPSDPAVENCTVMVPSSQNVVYVPRNNDVNGDGTQDMDITIRIKSGSDKPGKGNKINDQYPALTVTDWCTEHFPDYGAAEGDLAEVMLPENANGYGVYARITGKPLDGTAWTFLLPTIENAQDEYGNDLYFLGTIGGPDGCVDAEGNYMGDLDRTGKTKGNGKGNGVKDAVNLNCLLEFTGQVCYVNDLCYYCEGDSCNDVFDANDAGFLCCENHVDGDGAVIEDDCNEPANFACIDPDCDLFDASGACIGDWICPEGTNIVEPLCREYIDPTWVFNIADFVDILWKSETNGAYVVKLRFYAL